MLNIPLMQNNIDQSDIEVLIEFLKTSDRFTNGPRVREFEQAWSDWLGGGYHCVFVNSGSSANYITMAALKERYGEGEVILGPIGWTSDASSIVTAGLKPVFVDVNFNNLAVNEEQVLSKITDETRAVLVTHVLGYNGLTRRIVETCQEKNILLIEDVCESHGAVFEGKKCGTFGDVSNFSFYYAHHMSTIEGGMICTKDEELYRMMRMMRSHGMLRECGDGTYMEEISQKHPDVHPEFIFPVPGYNMRSTELNAVIGLNQLKRLDANIARRRKNYELFIRNLDGEKYFTDFAHEGNSNYAFVVMPNASVNGLYKKMLAAFMEEEVEFRRGTAGGGNMTRQPYLRKRYPQLNPKDYPNAEYIHENGVYIGNYPGLEEEKIDGLCRLLNSL